MYCASPRNYIQRGRRLTRTAPRGGRYYFDVVYVYIGTFESVENNFLLFV